MSVKTGNKKFSNSELKKKKKMFAAVTAALTVILTGEIIVYAWFTGHKSLKTVTEINTPYRLNLGAGNKEAITRLSLGNIDVKSEKFVDEETKTGKSFYVFSVSSDFDASNPYVIQLSHTTNIAFSYKIYHAEALGTDKSSVSEGSERENGLVEYITLENEKVYYCIDRDNNNKREVELFPQNIDTDNRTASEFQKTYGEYNRVQKYAQPVYCKTEAISPEGFEEQGSSFVDYYILEISWNTNEVSNDKETDLVYLMALRL